MRVLEGACPNLLAEAALYRYSDDAREANAEVPVDDHNHALAALRYLISKLDTGWMARLRKALHRQDQSPATAAEAPPGAVSAPPLAALRQ